MPVFNKFFLVDNKIDPRLLKKSGPIFPVEIHPPATLAKFLSDQGKPIPSPVVGDALFDTGASMTCVDDSVIQSLGVAPVGQGTVMTPSGQGQQSLYPARLDFPLFGFSVNFNSVFGAHLKAQGIIALVGRDVLQRVVMTYNGPGGFVTLSF